MVSNALPSTESPSAAPSQSSPSPTNAGSDSQLLQVTLATFSLLIPANQLVEILTFPVGQVVPVFHLPPWIPGVYNWRGEILWTMDLGHFLGASPWYQQTDYGAKHTVVILDRPHSKQLRTEERSPLGLIVNQVDGMLTGDMTGLLGTATHPDRYPPTMGGFAQGYWSAEGYPVLDGEALLKAMP